MCAPPQGGTGGGLGLRSRLLPLCLSHWNLISRATGAWDAPAGILLRWLLGPVLLMGLEKSLGKLIRWSDVNGGSLSPTARLSFPSSSFSLGFSFKKNCKKNILLSKEEWTFTRMVQQSLTT